MDTTTLQAENYTTTWDVTLTQCRSLESRIFAGLGSYAVSTLFLVTGCSRRVRAGQRT